jgi:hypothetical protein
MILTVVCHTAVKIIPEQAESSELHICFSQVRAAMDSGKKLFFSFIIFFLAQESDRKIVTGYAAFRISGNGHPLASDIFFSVFCFCHDLSFKKILFYGLPFIVNRLIKTA